MPRGTPRGLAAHEEADFLNCCTGFAINSGRRAELRRAAQLRWASGTMWLAKNTRGPNDGTAGVFARPPLCACARMGPEGPVSGGFWCFSTSFQSVGTLNGPNRTEMEHFYRPFLKRKSPIFTSAGRKHAICCENGAILVGRAFLACAKVVGPVLFG